MDATDDPDSSEDNGGHAEANEKAEDEEMLEEVPVAALEDSVVNSSFNADLEKDAAGQNQASLSTEPATSNPGTSSNEGSSAPDQAFQHVELHIVDSDEEAAELRKKFLGAQDQNVHLLACAKELKVEGLVPTQMDAMAGNTPLFTYVLSSDYMGAAQEIARSLVSGVEAAQQEQLERQLQRKTRRSAKASAKEDKALEVYDFEEEVDEPTKAHKAKKTPKRSAKKAKEVESEEAESKEGEPKEAESEEASEASEVKPAVVKKSKAGREMKCLYCEYVTNKKYLLIRHMRCHSDERPHQCPHSGCSRSFKTTSSLQNHMNTHSGTKPHACKYENCEASFTTSGELVRHVRYKHTHEKPHKCKHEGCGYSSVEMSKLRRHTRSHTGERPYKCPHCDYASPDTYKLKRHLRVHTGEKPYECDICHHKFTQSNSMKAHRMIHDAVKPVFQCQLCPAKCSRKTDLKIHIQKLHQSDQPIECKKCNRAFADRYLYNVHRKSDPVCGSVFTRVKGLHAARKRRTSRKKKGADEAAADEDVKTHGDEDMNGEPEAGDGIQDVGETEAEPGILAGFQSLRCILPDGDVVHILHNTEVVNGMSHIVTVTTSGPLLPVMVEADSVKDSLAGPEQLYDLENSAADTTNDSMLNATGEIEESMDKDGDEQTGTEESSMDSSIDSTNIQEAPPVSVLKNMSVTVSDDYMQMLHDVGLKVGEGAGTAFPTDQHDVAASRNATVEPQVTEVVL